MENAVNLMYNKRIKKLFSKYTSLYKSIATSRYHETLG